MGMPVLIIGKSGSGKSASLRNCIDDNHYAVVNVIDKPFPFKGHIQSISTDDYQMVMKGLVGAKAKSIVIDDAGYLITNMFMKGHSNAGAGNAVFSFYNKIGDHFWNLIEFIKKSVQKDRIVYIFMHEDTDDFGNIRPKTIGKLLDEKVCIEGMFTVVLRCAVENGKHLFYTQSTENDVAKTPIGMFDDAFIDNDLTIVDKAIREYYEMEIKEEQEPIKKEDNNND